MIALTGGWLLVAGYWWLVTGGWLLVAGYWWLVDAKSAISAPRAD
jgi:hypothetical protein